MLAMFFLCEDHMDTACFEHNPILFGNFLNNQTPASYNNITHVSEPLANDHVFNETVSSGICDLLDFEKNKTSTSLNISLSAKSDVFLHESNTNNNAAARMSEKLAKPSRKRQRNGEKWKIRANKKARQAGLEYISSTGLIMPRKLPVIDKDLCSCKKSARKRFQLTTGLVFLTVIITWVKTQKIFIYMDPYHLCQ